MDDKTKTTIAENHFGFGIGEDDGQYVLVLVNNTTGKRTFLGIIRKDDPDVEVIKKAFAVANTLINDFMQKGIRDGQV